MPFRICSDTFQGPIELLAYLVKRREIRAKELRLAHILEQYAEFVAFLREIDFEFATQFLEFFLQLLEVKTQAILGKSALVTKEAAETPPPDDWLEQLIAYREIRQKLGILEEKAEQQRGWATRQTRWQVTSFDTQVQSPSVEIWDLVQAFGRILREVEKLQQNELVLEDVPQEVFENRLLALLEQNEIIPFPQIFVGCRNRSEFISTFLGLLELIKRCLVMVTMPNPENLLLHRCNPEQIVAS